MEANNAEASTETSTEAPTGMFAGITNTEVTSTDTTETESSTEVSTIEATQETEVATDDKSGEVSTETTEAEGELFYEIDGKEVSASTVKEWQDGSLRQADYTKKSQVNAETKKALEAKGVEIDALKTRLTDFANTIESTLSTDYNKEDMDYLRDNDPSEYLRKNEERTAKTLLAQQAQQEVARLNQAKAVEMLEVEKQLLNDSMPAWIDPEVKKADIALLDAYTKELGYTSDDFKDMQKHKPMMNLLKAAKYDALQKSTAETAKQVQKTPKVIKAAVKQKATTSKSGADLFYGKT